MLGRVPSDLEDSTKFPQQRNARIYSPNSQMIHSHIDVTFPLTNSKKISRQQ